jgi:hypothetical protein
MAGRKADSFIAVRFARIQHIHSGHIERLIFSDSSETLAQALHI